ncbi:MAG: phosphonate ABC transporter ATP-binding protein [Chloroflexi bacterium]|nr:phosphonate ABC transporter ATP-binding protein [Chloroflexota bacterium]
MTTTLFELQNVNHIFGAFQALTDVSLRIEAGERVALVGSSGAGKSTLLALLNGSILPTQGSVKVLGRETASLSPSVLRQTQSQIGTIYQQFNLVDGLSVIHNVNAGQLGRWSLMKSIASLVRPLETETASRALAQVGIAEKIYERTDSLSGGQQQRVALARVLVQNPTAILADEPISNLDPERGREIMDLLRELCNTLNKTLVVTVHAIDFARTHFQRVIGLRHGSILFDLPAHQLTQDKIDALYKI